MKKFTALLLIILSISSFSQKEDKYILKGKNDFEKIKNDFEKAKNEFEKVENDFEKENYDAVLTNFNKALDINPTNMYTLYERGRVYEEKEDYKSAIIDYTNSIKEGYNFEYVYIRRGVCYKRIEQYDKALLDFNTALEKNEKSLTVLFYRGFLYLTLNKNNEAISDFTVVINDFSRVQSSKINLKNLYTARARCYYRTKQFKEELSDYYQIIEIDSTNSYYLSRIPAIKNTLKDYEGALEDCNNYLDKYQKRISFIKYEKAKSLKYLNRYEESMKIYNALITSNPGRAKWYNGKADLEMYNNNLEEALKDINTAIELNKTYRVAYVTKSEILYKMGDYDNMCKNYNIAIILGFDINAEGLNEIREKCKDNYPPTKPRITK